MNFIETCTIKFYIKLIFKFTLRLIIVLLLAFNLFEKKCSIKKDEGPLEIGFSV